MNTPEIIVVAMLIVVLYSIFFRKKIVSMWIWPKSFRIYSYSKRVEVARSLIEVSLSLKITYYVSKILAVIITFGMLMWISDFCEPINENYCLFFVLSLLVILGPSEAVTQLLLARKLSIAEQGRVHQSTTR